MGWVRTCGPAPRSDSRRSGSDDRPARSGCGSGPISMGGPGTSPWQMIRAGPAGEAGKNRAREVAQPGVACAAARPPKCGPQAGRRSPVLDVVHVEMGEQDVDAPGIGRDLGPDRRRCRCRVDTSSIYMAASIIDVLAHCWCSTDKPRARTVARSSQQDIPRTALRAQNSPWRAWTTT